MDDKATVLTELARQMARQDSGTSLPLRLCQSATAILGAGGGAITLSYTSEDRVTLCATDDAAARLEDLQEVLGQGPGPTAYRTGRQVRTVMGMADARWPQFADAAQAAYGAVILCAIPIRPQHEVLGVLTCHKQAGGVFMLDEVTAQFLADAVGVALLRDPDARALDASGPWSARAAVHQATGMVVAQLRISTQDALALMRAHAFAQETTLDDIAQAVLRRELDFTINENSDGTDPR